MTASIRAAADGNSGALQVGGVDSVPFTPAGGAALLCPLAASVNASALTVNLSNVPLTFRSQTLSDGSVTKTTTGPLSITIPSGATLGTIGGVAARLVLLVAYNAGSPVLCVANIAGGVQLDETNLISPTTISAAATSAGVIYSASAVAANSPYRVVGFVDSTQAAAGTWVTSPTLVQGCGGQALAALSSLGYGQTWQNVTGSRTIGTTYYNTTGRPILVQLSAQVNNTTNTFAFLINGVNVAQNGVASPNTGSVHTVGGVVPPGGSYSAAAAGFVLNAWSELR